MNLSLTYYELIMNLRSLPCVGSHRAAGARLRHPELQRCRLSEAIEVACWLIYILQYITDP